MNVCELINELHVLQDIGSVNALTSNSSLVGSVEVSLTTAIIEKNVMPSRGDVTVSCHPLYSLSLF